MVKLFRFVECFVWNQSQLNLVNIHPIHMSCRRVFFSLLFSLHCFSLCLALSVVKFKLSFSCFIQFSSTNETRQQQQHQRKKTRQCNLIQLKFTLFFSVNASVFVCVWIKQSYFFWKHWIGFFRNAKVEFEFKTEIVMHGIHVLWTLTHYHPARAKHTHISNLRKKNVLHFNSRTMMK